MTRVGKVISQILFISKVENRYDQKLVKDGQLLTVTSGSPRTITVFNRTVEASVLLYLERYWRDTGHCTRLAYTYKRTH